MTTSAVAITRRRRIGHDPCSVEMSIVSITGATDMRKCRNVIVIGASAGGLKALCRLLERLPERFPAAILLALHTARDSARLLPRIIARHTTLTVNYIRQGEAIRTGRIYLPWPDGHLVVRRPGVVRLSVERGPDPSQKSADALFESAAEVFGPRVIGVVLSGCDGDGTAGLRAIKEGGGLCLVQHPADAEVPSMPISAVRDDGPDYVLPVGMLGLVLARLASTAGVAIADVSFGASNTRGVRT
jgi:two-component system chemotaxis response regulator CheB